MILDRGVFSQKHLHPSQKCVFLSSSAMWHLASVASVCCPNLSLSVPLTILFLYCFCSPQSKVRAEMVRDRNNTHNAPSFPPTPFLGWLGCCVVPRVVCCYGHVFVFVFVFVQLCTCFCAVLQSLSLLDPLCVCYVPYRGSDWKNKEQTNK